jgi:hypothetical protein
MKSKGAGRLEFVSGLLLTVVHGDKHDFFDASLAHPKTPFNGGTVAGSDQGRASLCFSALACDGSG